MIHPATELRFVNGTVGYGVFATEAIPQGTITYAKDPLEIAISARKYQSLHGQWKDIVDKYSYTDERGKRLLSWDLAKYVNHCCNCNTMSSGWGFEIALRDIEEGEEITDEYGLFNIEKDMPLNCPYTNCRKVVRRDDIFTYYRQWDLKIKEALVPFCDVEQPLLFIISKKTQREVRRYLEGKGIYKSVLNLLAGRKLPA